MALYAFVALTYTVPLERALQTVDRHRAYLRELHAQGRLVCSGPFVPRTGGGLLLRVEAAEDVAAILEHDPLQIEGLVDVAVTLWDPNIGREGIDALGPVPKP